MSQKDTTSSGGRSGDAPEPEISASRPARRIAGWLIRAAATILLFLLIFKPSLFGIDTPLVDIAFDQVIEEIRNVSLSSFIPWFLAAALIKTFGILCSILRWRLLLRGQGIQMNFWHLVGSFLVGRFVGLPLPGTLGLDGYRLYDIGRHTGRWIESTTVIAVEKLIGFISLTFLVFITLPFGLSLFPIKPAVLIGTLGALGAFIAFSFVCLLNPRILQVAIAVLPVSRWPGLESKFTRIAQAITAYGGQKPLLLKAVFYGFMVHLATTVMYFCTAMSIRAESVKIAHILFASPIMIYGTVIGPSISGEGIREIVFVYLLGAKVGAAKAFLFSHLGLWAGEIQSVIGGFIVLLRKPGYRPSRVELADMRAARLAELPCIDARRIALYRQRILATAFAALGGGLVGGALTGLGEAGYVIATAQQLSEVWALPYAWFWHGLAGLAPGAAAAGSIVFLFIWRDKAWAARRVFGFSAGAAFASIGWVFARHRLVRDFLAEQKPSLGDELHLLLLMALCFALLRYGLSGLGRLKLGRWIGRWFAGPALYLGGLALLLGVGLARWEAEQGPPAPPPAPAEIAGRPSLLFIVVDTLRADRLACYGFEDVATSATTRLAADGIRYEHAIAQASWTRPSIATMLTGLYPSVHGAARKADPLSPSAPTLAEAISRAGFFAGGLVNNYNIAPYLGFERGFDHYVYLKAKKFFWASESASYLAMYEILRRVRQKVLEKLGRTRVDVYEFYYPADDVAALAGDWIERVKGAPFFYFVHFMDPHDPYMKHPFSGQGYARLSFEDLPSDMRDEIHETYLGEIEYVDAAIGRLIDRLKALGLYDDMAIIVTADHGEEFLDHGGWWHGRTLYEEMIRVPLIVKLPGNRHAGRVEPYQVRMLDLAPTICSLLGVEPPEAMQGAPLIRGGDPADPQLQTVFSEEDFEGNVLQSARTLGWKLIQANEGNQRGLSAAELYDLSKDPAELFNNYLAQPGEALRLRAWIQSAMAKNAEDAARLQQNKAGAPPRRP